MATCPEAREECAKFDTYLSINKYFDADPDIAGIGVITSILISAWISLAVALVAYFNDDSWKSTRLDKELITIPMRLRQQFSGKANHQETRSNQMQPRTRLLKSLIACVHAFSDQQLAIGIALLLTSYIQHCTITQYHFYVIYAESWISATVHQCAAQMVLRKKEVAPNKFRVGLIITLWPLLASSLVIVWNGRFLKVLGLSTQCIWDDPSRLSARSAFFMIVEQFTLAWGTIDTLGSYSVTMSRWMRWSNVWIISTLSAPGKVLLRIRQFRGQPIQRMQLLKPSWNDAMAQPSTASRLQKPTILLEVALWIAFILATMLLLVLESNLINLLRIIGILIIQTLAVCWTKHRAASSGEMEGSENEMGFGQIMPLLLLILPVLSIVQSYEDSKELDEVMEPSETTSTQSSRRSSEPQMTMSGALIEAESSVVSITSTEPVIGSTGIERTAATDDEGRLLVARVRTGTDLERRLAPDRLVSRSGSAVNIDFQEGSDDGDSISRDVAKLQDALCREPWFLTLIVALVLMYFVYIGLAFEYDLPVA